MSYSDKAEQLKNEGMEIENDIEILRIELKLKNRKKIKSVFDSSFWKDLSQEKLAEYFNQQIYENLLKKFNSWQLTREKELKRLIVDCRTKNKNTWHHKVMQEIRNKSESAMIPYILDIEQVCSAFNKLPDPHRNAQRALKALLSISIENDIYKNNDIAKIHEILETLNDYKKATSYYPQ